MRNLLLSAGLEAPGRPRCHCSVAAVMEAACPGKARAKRGDDEAFKKWFSDLTSSGVSEDPQASLLEEVQP